MKQLLVGASVMLFLVGVGQAQEKKNPATIPAEHKGTEARHLSFVERAKKGDVDVVFLGDSITHGWEGAGKKVWAANFEKLKAVNFGIGGDRTEHVLWRITEGKELEGITPKVAVLMIGTNNTGSNSPEQIAEGVGAIVSTLRQKNIKVLLLGVFPRAGAPKEEKVAPAANLNPKIKQINDIIKKMDDGKNIVYLDIGPKFLTEDGGLAREIMPDLLHLSPKGYEIWAEAITPKLEEMLK
ncbi:MAG TPA: GDSL-type esterase/lipase family protein [Gemmataceae bacterium]|jgi:lysophospholipase L1-like esterase|nr:GDSL-type esterase/lipase family protein [Gemmataceae bacterium]